MWNKTIAFVLALVLTGGLDAAPSGQSAREGRFPQPPALDKAVEFWTRVYTEVDYNSGFIHDNRHLNVVYETLRLRPEAGWRSQRRAVRKAIERYRGILRSLAAGRRTGLTPEQQRVLNLWGEQVSASELKAAAKRLRFQRGQADKFLAGIVRAGAWEEKILRILLQNGLPPELAALPHVESSYNPRAKSHAGASGLWQLMRSTGRRYLRVDHVVDERLDPMRATEGAARLLQHNYSVLKSWPLAITAYNHGLSGVRRAVRTTGSRDIGVIVGRYNGRLFGFASRNFYAAFLAALRVSEEPERYFGSISRERPTDYLRIASPAYFPVDALVDTLGVDRRTLQNLNPAVQPSVWKGAKFFPRDYELRLPPGLDRKQIAGKLQLAALEKGYEGQRPDRHYKVRRGDSLSVIARRYNTSVGQLMAMNSLRSRHRIRAGQTLRLPDAQAPKPLSLRAAAAMKAVYREPLASNSYRVKAGDTVSKLAHRFGVDEMEFLAANQIQDRNLLYAGQVLRIPVKQKPESAANIPMASEDPQLAKTEGSAGIPEAEAVGPKAVRPVVSLRQDERSEAAGDTALRGEISALSSKIALADVESEAAGDIAPRDEDSALSSKIALADVESEAVGDTAPRDQDSELNSDLAAAAGESEAVGDTASGDDDSEVISDLALADGSGDTPLREEGSDSNGGSGPISEASEAIRDWAAQDDESERAGDLAMVEDESEVVSDSVPVEPQPALSADPADYKAGADGSIEVQAAETLGHYADWLDIRASRLRRLNALRFGQPLVIGRRIRLDFSRVGREAFERRRLEHHQALQTRYFDRYHIVATRTHRVTEGDSLWLLATREYRIPLWLLRQYNPDVSFDAYLPPGISLSIPVVEKLGDKNAIPPTSTAST